MQNSVIKCSTRFLKWNTLMVMLFWMIKSRKETRTRSRAYSPKTNYTRDHRFTSVTISFKYRGLLSIHSTYRGRDHSKEAKTVEKVILFKSSYNLQPPPFKELGASNYIRREGREAAASVACQIPL